MNYVAFAAQSKKRASFRKYRMNMQDIGLAQPFQVLNGALC